jgi:hypothetical protein
MNARPTVSRTNIQPRNVHPTAPRVQKPCRGEDCRSPPLIFLPAQCCLSSGGASSLPIGVISSVHRLDHLERLGGGLAAMLRDPVMSGGLTPFAS